MRVVSVIEIFRKLTEVSGSKPIVTASATRLTGDLDGPRGFVFFLLIMVAPLFIAAGVTMTVWRLMEVFLPQMFAVPERLLFALSAFLTTCGSRPLAISWR
jgi:hypothetical protein